MAKKLTLKKFLADHNGSPYELEELASIAQNISDEEGRELRERAIAFLYAHQKLEQALEKVGYEEG